MSNTKHLLSLFAVVLAITLAVQVHCVKPENVKFYELKKGKLLVNFTNYGARIVSLNVPNKLGNASDIVLGYDSVDAYQKDKYCLGAVIGRFAECKFTINHNGRTNTTDGGRVGFDNVIWKVTKHDISGKTPSITFQYHNEKGFPGNLNVTATYLLLAKNKLKLTLCAQTKDKATTLLNLALNTYWNLGGHNSTGNTLHDQLRALASNYTELDRNLIPTGEILPVRNTPYDFQHFHAIQSRFKKLKCGYEVYYVVDQGKKNKVKLAAVLRDNRSGRVLKVWTDQPVVKFSTGDRVRNVRGKGGVLYQRNAGVLLAAQGYPGNFKSFPSQVITKEKPYKQITVFQFVIKK